MLLGRLKVSLSTVARRIRIERSKLRTVGRTAALQWSMAADAMRFVAEQQLNTAAGGSTRNSRGPMLVQGAADNLGSRHACMICKKQK